MKLATAATWCGGQESGRAGVCPTLAASQSGKRPSRSRAATVCRCCAWSGSASSSSAASSWMVRPTAALLSLGVGGQVLACARGFPGGVGNTRKDAEAFASLIHAVETRIFDVLPDETWVYPGHGGDTTLGAERPHLPEWHARGW